MIVDAIPAVKDIFWGNSYWYGTATSLYVLWFLLGKEVIFHTIKFCKQLTPLWYLSLLLYKSTLCYHLDIMIILLDIAAVV